jgi:hypothetical protein
LQPTFGGRGGNLAGNREVQWPRPPKAAEAGR